jgi:hypothetical protein
MIPARIAHLIASGQIAPGIIALTVLEICAITACRRRLFGGIVLIDYIPNILAGDFLLLAWAFSAAHWLCAAASLLGALLAHLTDMWRRLVSQRKKQSFLFKKTKETWSTNL